MKKRRVKRPQPALVKQKVGTPAETAKSELQPPSKGQSPLQGLKVLRAWLFRPIALSWAVALFALNLVQYAIQWRPQVTIQATISLDGRDPLATLFSYTNTGRLPIYDLRFGCRIEARDKRPDVIEGNGADQTSLEKLPANIPVTRGCFFRSQQTGIGGVIYRRGDLKDLEVTPFVRYKWPIVGWEAEQSLRFTARLNTEKQAYVLVPDPAP